MKIKDIKMKTIDLMVETLKMELIRKEAYATSDLREATKKFLELSKLLNNIISSENTSKDYAEFKEQRDKALKIIETGGITTLRHAINLMSKNKINTVNGIIKFLKEY